MINIPPMVKEAIDRHVKTGCPCGHFVTAILENNLKEAFVRADDQNSLLMRDIVGYLYNEIPSQCWGSKEKVKEWRSLGGSRGIEAKNSKPKHEF